MRTTLDEPKIFYPGVEYNARVRLEEVWEPQFIKIPFQGSEQLVSIVLAEQRFAGFAQHKDVSNELMHPQQPKKYDVEAQKLTFRMFVAQEVEEVGKTTVYFGYYLIIQQKVYLPQPQDQVIKVPITIEPLWLSPDSK